MVPDNLVNRVPYCINCASGDPFTENQMNSTISKMHELIDAKNYFSVCSKAKIDQDIKSELLKISSYDTSKMFLGYSLTGLNEGGIDWKDRVASIRFLFETFGQVLIMARPMIYGRNMTLDNARRIIEVAADTSKTVSFAGKHDSNKRKSMSDDFIMQVEEICKEYAVINYRKTSCAASDWYKVSCIFHSEEAPKGLQVLDALGYSYQLEDKTIVLDAATTGDINFVHLLTRARVLCRNHISNSNVLSFSLHGAAYLECTSSGFSWSDNVACSVNCDYCIIREIPYLEDNTKIGVSPYELTKEIKRGEVIFNKIPNDKIPSTASGQLTSYQDVRKSQRCKALMLKNVNKDWRQAIGCILYVSGKYLMVHKKSTSDVKIKDFRATWDLLKGGCHPSEAREHTVHRELHEELGLTAKNIERMEFMDQVISFEFPENSNYKGQITQMTMIQLKEDALSEIVMDEQELDSIELSTFQELVDRISLPETQDFLIRNQEVIQSYFDDNTDAKERVY